MKQHSVSLGLSADCHWCWNSTISMCHPAEHQPHLSDMSPWFRCCCCCCWHRPSRQAASEARRSGSGVEYCCLPEADRLAAVPQCTCRVPFHKATQVAGKWRHLHNHQQPQKQQECVSWSMKPWARHSRSSWSLQYPAWQTHFGYMTPTGIKLSEDLGLQYRCRTAELLNLSNCQNNSLPEAAMALRWVTTSLTGHYCCYCSAIQHTAAPLAF